jgi:hypothetical protein
MKENEWGLFETRMQLTINDEEYDFGNILELAKNHFSEKQHKIILKKYRKYVDKHTEQLNHLNQFVQSTKSARNI